MNDEKAVAILIKFSHKIHGIFLQDFTVVELLGWQYYIKLLLLLLRLLYLIFEQLKKTA